MPYVDIVAKDDYASIWYWTNTYNNNVGIFDPDKPTVVLLHPAGLDSSWMQPQAEDPRLHGDYNIIMFDTRISGQSECRFSGKHDLWVTAADLAQAFYHLRLPPSHIFAPDLHSQAGLRLAVLFPELCLSVTICNVAPPNELKNVFDSLEELNRLWGEAQDLETFEHACKEFLQFFAGPHAHPDLQDEIVAFWESYYPPFRRVYSMALMNLILNRNPMSAKELAAVTAPVLIIQAESSSAHPFKGAEQLKRELIGVPGGASLFPLKATAGYLSIVCASIVNQVFVKFLRQQPKPSYDLSRLYPSKGTLREFMAKGLKRLAEFRDDASIASRNPQSPLSFSCVSDQVAKKQMDRLQHVSIDQRKAFSPLGSDGRPQRKFSERNDHWLAVGRDGYSRSDTIKRPQEDDRDKKKLHKNGDKRAHHYENGVRQAGGPPHSSQEDLTPLEPQPIARTKKSAHAPDKQVKGTMAKVVASSPSFNRLLR